MTQGLLQWSPCHRSLSLLPISIPTSKHTHLPLSISATLESSTQQQQQLSARERRQLRNERRESKAGTNWKEKVEEKLLEKPTQKFVHWKEELNINNLAREGPQWWIVRVSRVKGQDTAQLIARLLARNYPHMDLKVYAPTIPERRKLKNENRYCKSNFERPEDFTSGEATTAVDAKSERVVQEVLDRIMAK